MNMYKIEYTIAGVEHITHILRCKSQSDALYQFTATRRDDSTIKITKVTKE